MSPTLATIETCHDTKETYKRDLQKRPTKEAYQRDLQKRPTKETYKRDLQKRPTKETCHQRVLRMFENSNEASWSLLFKFL